MRPKYDPEVGILYIRLSEAPIANSESVEPNLVLDRDTENNVVGIEVLWASRLAGASPMAMTFEVIGAVANRPAVPDKLKGSIAAEKVRQAIRRPLECRT